MFSAEGHACKLCPGRLGTCPHGSARLYLRPPLQSLWRVHVGARREELPLSRAGWRALVGLAAVYLVAAIALIP